MVGARLLSTGHAKGREARGSNGGESDVRCDRYRQATRRGGALGIAIGASLILAGCGGASDVTLPADKEESAALCYGATLALAGEQGPKGPVTVDQASQAAHFAFLGGSLSGVGEPTKIDRIGARGQELQRKIRADKNAASYTTPCAKAFPETQAAAFKGLPADNRDTRMMCYTLSTALLQIFARSDMAPDPRAATYVKLNTTLEQALQTEVDAAGKDINLGELAGRAMRGMAQAVRLGPPVDVMKACGDRYVKS